MYMKTANQRYKEAHPGRSNELNKIIQLRARTAAIEILGGKCCKCGFTDLRALQIDHVNSNAKTDKKGYSLHKKVIQATLNNDNQYQLLCANCNWIKRWTNDEVTGRPRTTNHDLI